jgi:hypothetical protein
MAESRAMTARDLTPLRAADGRADKGLTPLGGRPMHAHVVERLAPQCAALALSADGDE